VLETLMVVTNTNRAFDGYVRIDATMTNNANLKAGDSAGPTITADLLQFANDRDHHFSSDVDTGPAWGNYGDAATIQIGNAGVGGGPGEDNYHAYLTFGLWSVPADGMVTAATLFVHQAAAAGGGFDNPVHVDHVDYQNTFAATPLDASRFNCTAPRSVIQADMGTFNTLAAAGWVRIPSTSQVQFAEANPKSFTENGDNRVFQVMLRDNSAGLAAASAVVTFDSHNSGGANRPYLRVYYQVPGKETRALTSFNIDKVTNVRSITSATMFVYRQSAVGSGEIDPIRLDHVDYGATLDGADFNPTVIASGIASIPTGTGWYGASVRSAVSNAWTNKKVWTVDGSQRWFQVRMRPNAVDTNDLELDRQEMGSAETATKAYLKVRYLKTYMALTKGITNSAILGTNISIFPISVAGLSNTTMVAYKYLTNVQLKGNASARIPGASLWFKIVCTNKTMVNGKSVVVFDKVDSASAAYATNSATRPAGWFLEYSTNTFPAQAYMSADYRTNVQASLVKWVRWKRASWLGNANDTFRYRVTVK